MMGARRLLPRVPTAISTYAEPVSAVIFAAILLGERISWATVVGDGASVLAGGWSCGYPRPPV
jgi:drug/metabolite transporter (DMT)-like permease